MVDFKYYINQDWFKAGRFGEKHVKQINIALLIITCVLLVSLIFYIIMFSTTNFSALDDLEEYVEKYDEEENAQFDNINLAMKIMPSYNTEKNVLYMEHTNNFYKSKIENSLDLMESFNMNNTFFFINKTALFFPRMSYITENVPIGDSISMCVAVSWTNKERGENYDIMKPVLDFPQCQQTLTGKFIWNNDDPKHGIDVPVWEQSSFDIDCTDVDECIKSCKERGAEFNINGINSKKCYTYKVLDGICLTIEYDPNTEDYKFTGGCFRNNKHYMMVDAVPDNVYRFDDVEIEVRNKKDPIIKAGEMSNFTFSFGTGWKYVGIFLNFLLILSFIALIGIIGLIFHYRRKYNTGALLSEKPGAKFSQKNAPGALPNDSRESEPNV
jgi:hypothetical protein